MKKKVGGSRAGRQCGRLRLRPLPAGAHALILVGLERAANLEQLTQLEFGRGFTYNRPLSLNLLDLDYELAEQLVGSRVATAGDPPRRLSPRGLRLSPWGPPLRLRPLRRSYALLGAFTETGTCFSL